MYVCLIDRNISHARLGIVAISNYDVTEDNTAVEEGVVGVAGGSGRHCCNRAYRRKPSTENKEEGEGEKTVPEASSLLKSLHRRTVSEVFSNPDF